MFPTRSECNPEGSLAVIKFSLPVALFRLMRPSQWVKNGFVLGPLIFSRSFESFHSFDEALVATAAFCLASSAGYIVNDICDRETDKLHPLKRLKRPIAAGEVSVRQAVVLLAGIAAALIGILIVLPAIIPALGAYVALSFTYSVALKKVPVIDLFAIAAGFVLRAYAGATAIHVPLSFWMSITTLCLALYLAATKRKEELARNGSGARGVLLLYTPELLTSYAQTAAVTSVIFYGLYVATVATALVASLPLVLLGLFRYQFIVEVKGGGESPADVLLADPMLLLTAVSWAVLCAYLLR